MIYQYIKKYQVFSIGEIIREYYDIGELKSEVYAINGKKNDCNKMYHLNVSSECII